jgi:hypothetical protein
MKFLVISSIVTHTSFVTVIVDQGWMGCKICWRNETESRLSYRRIVLAPSVLLFVAGCSNVFWTAMGPCYLTNCVLELRDEFVYRYELQLIDCPRRSWR